MSGWDSELVAKVAEDWRKSRHRNTAPPSKVTTEEELQVQLRYLDGFHEAQIAAWRAFKDRRRAADRAKRSGA